MSVDKRLKAKGKAALARVAYIAPSSHSHLNGVELSAINQNLATTDDVTFNSITVTTTITTTTSITTGDLTVGGIVKLTGLPTSDPLVVDQLWNNGGVLTISAG